jgi:hypothetical protein
MIYASLIGFRPPRWPGFALQLKLLEARFRQVRVVTIAAMIP